MELIRTSLRLTKKNKINAVKKARELNTTLQDVFNQALENYLDKLAQKKAKQIVWRGQAIDRRLDNLTRDDYYED